MAGPPTSPAEAGPPKEMMSPRAAPPGEGLYKPFLPCRSSTVNT
jgi:hypothetical protein